MEIKPPTNHRQMSMVPLADVTPNPKHPHPPTEKAILLLASGIERWGFLIPIIIDENGMIVAGHARYMAAKRLRLEQLLGSQSIQMNVYKVSESCR